MRPLWLIFIPLFPLFGFLANGAIAFQRARNKGVVSNLWVAVLGCTAPILSFALTLKVFFVLQTGQSLSLPHIWDWIATDDVRVSLSLTMDRLGAVILLIFTLLGSVTALLDSRKQKTNKNAALHLSLLNLFVFVAILVVMSGSLNFLSALTREILWITGLAVVLIALRCLQGRTTTPLRSITTLVTKPVTWFADVALNRGVDRVVVDGVLLKGTARFAQVLSAGLARLQTGSLNFALLILASTLLAVLAWVLL